MNKKNLRKQSKAADVERAFPNDFWLRAGPNRDYYNYLLNSDSQKSRDQQLFAVWCALPLSEFAGVDSRSEPGNLDSLISELYPRPDMRFEMTQGVLRTLATNGLVKDGCLTKIEARFLSLLLLKLALTSNALRELGIKKSKQHPVRDLNIAEDYLWLRECGVASDVAKTLLLRKWRESESNIKRLITGPRRSRAKEILSKLKQKQSPFSSTESRLGYQSTRRRSFRTHANLQEHGVVASDAMAAAEEIDRLTASLLS